MPDVKEMEDLLATARSHRRRFEPVWFMNVAYYEGQQWLMWANNRLVEPTLGPNRLTITDNRIQPAVRTEIAKLTKHRPTFICTPRTNGDEDISAAEMAEKVLEYQWDHLNLPELFPKCLLWSRTVCAGFLKVIWDKTLGNGVDILVGPDGNPIQGPDGRPLRAEMAESLSQSLSQSFGPGAVKTKRIHQGDIRVVVRSPFQIFPDPLAETFGEIEWLIEESVVSKGFCKSRYGKSLEPDTVANPGLVQSHLGFIGAGQGSYKGVKIKECWYKPCEEYPDGARVTWGGKEILEVDQKPFDPMPYVMFSGIESPGRFWPTCITEQLRGPQTELNKLESQLAENRNRIGNPTLLANRDAIEDPDAFESQTGQTGGIYYYNSAIPDSIPQYLQAPEMPAYVVQERDRIEASIQEISGQHEVSSAQVPAGVTAASAINLLQEADDTRLGPASTSTERGLATLGTKILRHVAKFYDDQRTIALAGDNNAWEIFDFKGQMLRDHTHVQVQAGSTFPRSLAAKQAQMDTVLNSFIQNGIAFKDRDLAKFFREYQIGGLEQLIGQVSRDEVQVNRENRQLTLGEFVPVNEFDNDDLHIEGHEDFQKTFRYFQLSDPIKQLFSAHVQAHRDKVAAQEAAQMQMEMAPQLAQTAQQLQLGAAQGGQQLAQKDELHQQRVQQADELHQQRLQQARQQPAPAGR